MTRQLVCLVSIGAVDLLWYSKPTIIAIWSDGIESIRTKAARDMGWKTLPVNAVRGNQDILRIYERIGFHYIDRYPECSDPVEVAPWQIFMQ